MAKFSMESMARPVDPDRIKQGRVETYLDRFSGAAGNQVIMIPRNRLVAFPDHPFRVEEDEDMLKLVESIRENGVLEPILVKPLEGGDYRIIAGHRRDHACGLAGLSEIPAIIRDVPDDQAVIDMVDSNLRRERIRPSERAWAYRMKMDALKRQGKRPDLTSRPMGEKLKGEPNGTSRPMVGKLEEDSTGTSRPMVGKLEASDYLGRMAGESGRQVQRYIRLTWLIDPLAKMVDNKRLGFRCGVELSYLDPPEQEMLVRVIADGKAPNIKQSEEIRKLSMEGKLTEDSIKKVLCPNVGLKIEPPAKAGKAAADSAQDGWLNGREYDATVGFILKAAEFWNRSAPDELITQETLDRILTGIEWASTELTVDEAAGIGRNKEKSLVPQCRSKN